MLPPSPWFSQNNSEGLQQNWLPAKKNIRIDLGANNLPEICAPFLSSPFGKQLEGLQKRLPPKSIHGSILMPIILCLTYAVCAFKPQNLCFRPFLAIWKTILRGCQILQVCYDRLRNSYILHCKVISCEFLFELRIFDIYKRLDWLISPATKVELVQLFFVIVKSFAQWP